MEIPTNIQEKLESLGTKYQSIGQDMASYLDGLLYANTLPYWDYTQVDTLLTLQKPKTDFPDEVIFIVYHQITELYFRLSLHELEQICHNGRNISEAGQDLGWNKELSPVFFAERLGRINRYFEALTKSFDIMVDGMEPAQFLKFRMALLPASGFQSAQYRMIEICATDLIHLTEQSKREDLKARKASVDDLYEHIYWKQGATEQETGKKTLTLIQFEKKYASTFIGLAGKYESINLWKQYCLLNKAGKITQELTAAMKQFDLNVNVNWPLVHYKSAVRYLNKGQNDVAATGGTNWQKYLPPRFQKRVFYPELWTARELETWGKP